MSTESLSTENKELKQQLQCTRELRAVELEELKLKTELAAEARTENNALRMEVSRMWRDYNELRNLFDERATEIGRLSRELVLANISTLKLRDENAELKHDLERHIQHTSNALTAETKALDKLATTESWLARKTVLETEARAEKNALELALANLLRAVHDDDEHINHNKYLDVEAEAKKLLGWEES